LEDTLAKLHKLTALQVRNAKPADRLSDGGGLRLDVDGSGNGAWIFRFTSPVTGKERFMGLGPARDVPLAKAREAAQQARDLLRDRIDPIEVRKEQRAAAKVGASRSVTFRTYAERFVAGRESGWKNDKHRQQWRNSLRDYAYPHIGDTAVAEVDTYAVLLCLRPIWSEKKETARRLRGRIEMILNAAKAEGLRSGDNPALWRGHLDQVLARRKKSERKHHAALPYGELPAFMAALRSDTSDAARLLEFIILTAVRYDVAPPRDGEVTGDLWSVPALRMKAERNFDVPLSAAAAALLPVRKVSGTALANCIRRHTATPATTHGFRSTFRDWAGDCTSFSREVAEMALAHAVEDETEAAYRRSTALEKRRQLMEAWAKFCAASSGATVVLLTRSSRQGG
jgi:integrase